MSLLLATFSVSAIAQSRASDPVPKSLPVPAKSNPTPAPSINANQQSASKSATSITPDFDSLAPAPPPPGPTNRPRIGLALGGGGALGLSEVGVLEWFEDHHIPIDMIAGTSMGCMIAGLYATGKTTDQLKVIMDDTVFSSVFAFSSTYQSLNFRRREESRAIPNAITLGLKHGVSLRNSVLADQGLNAFLDRQFLRYDDRIDFNTLPIPIRCISTDLTDAKAVTFARGSLPDAIRASVSLPAVFRPFELNGHELVDGGVLDNLPTPTLRNMQADVILAISLPLAPLGTGDLGSIFGVLQRSFSVAIEGSEREARKLANVVIIPDITGFSATDYLKGADLSKRGYDAAEQHKDQLLAYALPEDQWQQHLAARIAKMRGAPGPLLRVRVQAPNENVTRVVEQKFNSLIGQPVDTKLIEAKLDEVRSDGRYDANFNIIYESTRNAPGLPPVSNTAPPPATTTTPRPTVIISVLDKKTGPPFLLVGTNIMATTGNDITRGTLEMTFLHQDLGGYGSELRGNVKVGFYTQLDVEYYRHLANLGHKTGGVFLAPHAMLLRDPQFIYQGQKRLSRRQLQALGGGIDLGWSDQRIQELRLGWESNAVRWQTQVGADPGPEIIGGSQHARIRYVFDTQDRALVPQYGIRSITEAGYLYKSVASSNAPIVTTKLSFAHQIEKNLFIFAAEGGTYFNRNVAEPFRFTLGGPLRLTASAIGEYRGTDYFLLEPAFLRRIAKLPDPLGQSIYIGAAYEAGQMHAPGQSTITRQDLYFGLVAETPLGIVTLAPSIGDGGHRKLTFTLGRLF